MKSATLTPCILKQKQRQDKTWQVLVRLSYDGKSRYIPTSMFCTKKDITSSFKIKNQRILDECAYLVSECRQRLAALHISLHDYTIDEIFAKIQKRNADLPTFTEYFAIWCKQNSDKKGLENYRIAYRSFCRFLRHDNISFDEINNITMKAFEIALKGHPHAQHNYISCIKKVFNDAKEMYNDEDRGIVPIKHSIRHVPPKPNRTSERALTTDMIRRIFALPYNDNWRRNFALDLFRISFCLMGMNGIDLYNCTKYEDGYITYNRTKTASRRADGSLMVVKVHDYIKPLIEKYRGKKHVFNFSERFDSYNRYYKAIKIGMEWLSKELGVWVVFYSARHTMATIAVNEAGINKYIVNDMLCHKDPTMTVTDMYIKKDFKPMNDANAALISYVLKTPPTFTG